MPQFAPTGSDVAAPRLRAAPGPELRRAQSGRPDDQRDRRRGLAARRRSGRPRRHHSPTTFIPDLGRAYRRERADAADHGRARLPPVPRHSSIPPTSRTRATPRSRSPTTASSSRCSGRRSTGPRRSARRSRSSTTSSASSRGSPAAKARVYTGAEPPAARRRRRGDAGRTTTAGRSTLAACQPTVAAFLIFHVSDEPQLDRCSPGVFYADDTPKSSLAPVRAEALAARAARSRLRRTDGHRMLLRRRPAHTRLAIIRP